MNGQSADLAVERRTLLWSITITAALGAVGVVWGIASGSQMILLDGVYGFVGVLTSLVLLYGATVATSEPTARYPFGRESMTPLVIGVQGFVLLATLFYAAVEAAFTIVAGGSEVTAGSGILYGMVATVGSLLFWTWIHRKATASEILRSEAVAWKVAAFRGLGMMAGFSLMLVLAGSGSEWLVPYIDPGMVLVTCIVFMPAPIRLIRATLIELLEGSPTVEVQSKILGGVTAIRDRFGLAEPKVLMTKVGRKVYVEVVAPADPAVTVAQEHEVRTALGAELERLGYEIWLTLELMPRTTTV